MNVIVSTVGTSTLTNSFNKDERNQGHIGKFINKSNDKLEDLDNDSREMLYELDLRAQKVLAEGDINKVCKLSAELNGICHIYIDQGSPLQNDIFKKGNKDVHILIATDTAHGRSAAKLIGGFLTGQGITVINYTPPRLTTANTKVFWEGIKELLV